MFGKKQELTKELEEKLSKAQRRLENLQSQMGQVQNQTQQILPLFESQIIAQSQMDKELTKVVSHAYDTIEGAADNVKTLEQLAMELTSMRGQLEDEEQDKKKLREITAKQKSQMEAIEEENKKFTEPITILQEVRIGLEEDTAKMREEVSQMLDYAKQMTVTALNCAIEAGRMGEAGKRFIEAAEEVRLLSSSYERAAGITGRQLDDIEKRMRQLEAQVAALTKTSKESNVSFNRLSRNISDQEDICNKAAERHYLEKAVAISDNLKKISQNNDTIDSLQHETLADIEHIGESFMNEQEARKALEQIVDRMIEAMRG